MEKIENIFKAIDVKTVHRSAVGMIADQWMLITAGVEGDFNTMTANWGGLGEIWFKDAAFVFIRPQRYTYEFSEKYENMTLSFFGEGYRKALQLCGSKSGRDIDKVKESGLTTLLTSSGGVAFKEAELVLECRKMYSAPLQANGFVDQGIIERCYVAGDFHKIYVVEILSAWKK